MQSENDSQAAVVEFDNAEDAEYALTKNGQLLDGNEIEISQGSKTTLFVSNYPAHADESFIRGLFEEYGEIVAVRFPSLKYNTHRRFCYVQFMTQEQAVNACALNGREIDGLELVAKISDPSRKKEREGAAYEGREVFVRNVHWGAQEEDVKTRFVQFGTVESVRIPTKLDGKSKGVAFVVFQTKVSLFSIHFVHRFG
jgi:squamous cell carcinoma antigen recognized by T-cells 3